MLMLLGMPFQEYNIYHKTDDAKYVIWVSGSLYQTFNTAQGKVEYSGTDAFDAIATAQSGAFITPGLGGAGGYGNEGQSTIKIEDGAYLLPGNFTGFDLWKGTHIKMGRNARITVPYQYSGHIFRIANGNVYKTLIEGGFICETGDPNSHLLLSGRNWAGFYIHSSGAAGAAFATIRDTTIYAPNIGIYMRVDGTDSWANGNTFEDVLIERPKTSIRLVALSGTLGIERNYFSNVIGQNLSGYSRVGLDAENLAGNMNVFHDCKFWDLAGLGVYSAHIGLSGHDTIIIGGIIRYLNFYDSGRGTFGVDQFQGMTYDGSGGFQNLTVESGLVAGGVMSPRLYTPHLASSGQILTISDLGSGQPASIYMYGTSGINSADISLWGSINFTERLLILKATENVFNSNRFLSGGTQRPTVFQMQDTPNAVMIEPLRLDISGNVEMNRSGGTVQFNSGNTSLTRTVTAAMSGAFGPLGFLTVRLGDTL